MLRLIALKGVRTHENEAHLQRRENVIHGDRSREVELLPQLENKQQIITMARFYMHRDFAGVSE